MLSGLGGLVGELDGGKVDNCRLKNIKLSQKYDPIAFQTYNFRFTGGLIGKVNNSSDEILDIKNSSVEDVYIMVGGTGFEDDAGGFIGEIDSSDTDVETKGNIKVENCNVSGVVGGGGHLGNTFGLSLAGGFVGMVNGSGTPDKLIKIINCDAKVDIKELRIGMSFFDTAISIGGIGGFAGRLHFVDVSNCSAEGSYGIYGPSDLTKDAIDEFSTINGFAGWVTDSTIIDSSTDCEIFGNGWGSGFSFMFSDSKMERVDVNVRRHIRIEGLNASSLISWSAGESTIKDCIISGYMDKGQASGGVIGTYSGQFVLENVIINSKIEDYKDSGILMGLTGELKSGKGIYYNKTLNPTIPVGGNSNVNDKYVEGKSQEDLMKISTFVGYDISLEGTDENTVWKIKEGESLPYLNKSYDAELAKEEIKAALGDWIPLANKEEIQQINKDEALIFGAGTLYEDTYTGGLDKKYILVKDIDLENVNFMPIGYIEGTSKEFTGKLKGNKFKITNLKIDRDKGKQGLFTILGEGSEIMGLTIEGADMKTGSYSGVLAGEAKGAKIEDCKISSVEYDLPKYIEGRKYYDIGGYIGKSQNTSFIDNELEAFNMEIADESRLRPTLSGLGGLAGELDGGIVEDCDLIDIRLVQKFDKDTMGTYDILSVGGLLGKVNNSTDKTLEIKDSKVEDVYIMVGGPGENENAGGLIGQINTKDSVIDTNGNISIENCSVDGTLGGGGNFKWGTSIAGGFLGLVDGSGTPEKIIKISDCESDVDIKSLYIPPYYTDTVNMNGGIGGFVGRALSTEIRKCSASGSHGEYTPSDNIGVDFIDEFATINGFAGWLIDSKVIDSSVDCEISGSGWGGAFSFMISDSVIERVSVNASNHSRAGGLNLSGFTATAQNENTIKNCKIIGRGEKVGNAAGLIGNLLGEVNLENILVSYKVPVALGSGSIIGDNDGTRELKSAKAVYYNKTLNPIISIGGNSDVNDKYVEGKTEEDLMKISTFADYDISLEDSDDNTVWKIKEGESLPYLNKDYDSTIVKEDPSPIILKSVALPEIKAVKAVEVILEEPKKEAPVAEESKKEATMTEESKEESPVAEEPKEEAPVAEEPKEEAPVAEEPEEEAPVVEEPKEEVPVVEEPKEEEPAEEETKEEQATEAIGGFGLRIVQGCVLCEVKGVSCVIVAPRGSKERGE
jgi:hypothetical protein